MFEGLKCRAQLDIANQMLENGLFSSTTVEGIAANVKLRRIERTDKSFAWVLVAYLDGRINKDELELIINERLKNEQ